MIGKAVILEDNTPVEVKLSADERGQVSMGIRINGSQECVLAQGVTMPEPRNTKAWTKNVGDLV